METKKTIKKVAKPSVYTSKQSALAEILSKDKQLGEDTARLQLFLSLANMFDRDLKDNIALDSFALDEKYLTNDVHAWVAFKRYAPVQRYVKELLDEKQYSEALKTVLGAGIDKVSDAINVQNIIEGRQKAEQNTNVIVVLAPQKNYKKVI